MLYSFCEEINCNNVKSQMLKDEKISLKGRILIVSDRLRNLALTLSEYIDNITEADVVGVAYNSNDIEKFTDQGIDYIIIVGYLRNEIIYNSINKLYNSNKSIKVVKWALLDSLVMDYCLKYGIEYKYERNEAVRNFMQYLIDIRADS